MDISKIKYIIDFSKKTGIHYALEQEDIEILEHILAEREEDKKKIEELEKENKRKDMFVKMAKEVIEESILKQKNKRKDKRFGIQ